MKFPWYLWKIFFSISHFLWLEPCCKLKQQHVGIYTFQHCQILYNPFGRDRTNKRIWNFYLSFYIGITSVQLPTFLSTNAGSRIHPYLVGRIIRHDAHRCCSHLTAVQQVRPLNYQKQNFKVKCKSRSLKEQTIMPNNQSRQVKYIKL